MVKTITTKLRVALAIFVIATPAFYGLYSYNDDLPVVIGGGMLLVVAFETLLKRGQ